MYVHVCWAQTYYTATINLAHVLININIVFAPSVAVAIAYVILHRLYFKREHYFKK